MVHANVVATADVKLLIALHNHKACAFAKYRTWAPRARFVAQRWMYFTTPARTLLFAVDTERVVPMHFAAATLDFMESHAKFTTQR